jgi:integrase
MKHLRETLGGFQKNIRIGGKLFTEFSYDRPSANEVKQWVRKQHANAAYGTKVVDAPSATFEDAAADYLESVTAMPSYADRELHINEWAEHFAGRDPATITALEIRTRLDRLRRTYAASSCNHRRTALLSFYTAINGRSGYNPVRDVRKYQEEEEPRGESMWTAYRILALMQPSQTRARLRVILWTGWPHKQLARLRPEHLDLRAGRAFVTPRRKGKGRKGVWLPLLPGAIIALRDFIKWDCFTPTVDGKERPFSASAMHSAFARALVRFNEHRARFGHRPIDMHPYDLRHTFGTWVAQQITDERAIQQLMLHSNAAQTRRYTERATEARVATAVAILSRTSKHA